jgi:hypothetical protein
MAPSRARIASASGFGIPSYSDRGRAPALWRSVLPTPAWPDSRLRLFWYVRMDDSVGRGSSLARFIESMTPRA